MSNSGFFCDKRVLVAGGTGLIGRPLVQMLVDRGAQIRIASLDNGDRAHPKVEYRSCDLTYLETCLWVCADMDIVFNLLCTKGSPKTAAMKPASYFVPMIMYNTNLMEAARRCNVKSFLFTSSNCVYPPAEVFYENDPLEGPYSPNDPGAARAKRAGEYQAKAYAIEYDWDNISIVRPANVYGPYDNFNPFNSMVVPSLIKKVAKANEEIDVWGDGSAIRDFIYTDDVARGMLLAVEKQLGPDSPINLGSGTGVTIKQLVETIVKISGKKLEIIWDTSKPSGDKKRLFDTTQAKKFGFAPQVSLEEGLKITYNWYLENEDLAEKKYDIFNRPE